MSDSKRNNQDGQNELSPINARRVDEHEQGQVNIAYYVVAEGENINKFMPVQGVKYIWLYTAEKQLIIGIDEPWKYPQAFEFSKVSNSDIPEPIKRDIRTMVNQNYGHPTILSSFNKLGLFQNANASVQNQGMAFLGGELRFSEEEKSWVLDNQSGRFGRFRRADLKIVKGSVSLMNDVAQLFQQATQEKFSAVYRYTFNDQSNKIDISKLEDIHGKLENYLLDKQITEEAKIAMKNDLPLLNYDNEMIFEAASHLYEHLCQRNKAPSTLKELECIKAIFTIMEDECKSNLYQSNKNDPEYYNYINIFLENIINSDRFSMEDLEDLLQPVSLILNSALTGLEKKEFMRFIVWGIEQDEFPDLFTKMIEEANLDPDREFDIGKLRSWLRELPKEFSNEFKSKFLKIGDEIGEKNSPRNQP